VPRSKNGPHAIVQRALFVSRAAADADFAAVIGAILQDAGYSVILQQWDFGNRNFIERVHAALAEGARVVALLSPEYLRSDQCQAEWQNAIADDPLNTRSRLILLRVVECEPVGLLSGLAYWDLVPIRDNRPLLREIVREAVREDRRDVVPSGPYWRAPRSIVDAEAIRPVPSFSGREPELAAIAAALSKEGAIAAVHGLGGVGKSSIAREYAWRSREEYSIVWWLNAQTEDAIIDGLLRLGALFVRGLDRVTDRRAAAQQVTTSVLSGFSNPVLLIFDNLEDEPLLWAWRPRTGSRVLVTSRSAVWETAIATISLRPWELETAVDYLQRESGRTDLAPEDTRAIAEALGTLPLALSHAAASLRGMRMVAAGRYLERIGEHLKNAPRGAEYPQSVFATFRTAIAHAEREAAGAAAVLCFAASFAPDAIPDELFRQSIEHYPAGLRPELSEGGTALDLGSACADALHLDEALGALDRLSILAFSGSSRAYSMHRLVQLAGQDLGGACALGWRECAAEVADAAFPEVEFSTWAQCARLLPHVRAALEALPSDATFLPAGRLANRCAVYLRKRGEYAMAEILQKRSVTIREKALGPEHPDVARSLNNLANVYLDQGRYQEAEALYTRALGIREKALGPDHSDAAACLDGLAVLHREQGRYAEAERLQRRALALKEKALGPDHPDVALSLNNLAVLCGDQGRIDQAEALHRRALTIKEKALGPDHPDVALSLLNLANECHKQGRLEEAEALHTRALAVKEKALGPDHPSVAISLDELANVYYEQRRYERAQPLLERALAILEKSLGPDHSHVAHSLNGLGNTYREQGRYEDAEPLLVRALAIREKAFGADHPDVATSLTDLGKLYEAQKRFEEAERLFARALALKTAAR
jgi:tetratricopeptide (TPR) repeat protein